MHKAYDGLIIEALVEVIEASIYRLTAYPFVFAMDYCSILPQSNDERSRQRKKAKEEGMVTDSDSVVFDTRCPHPKFERM